MGEGAKRGDDIAAWLADAQRRGLFGAGLPAPWGSDGGYAEIAAVAGRLTRESGDPSVGMSFAVRQLAGRFFIAAHGSAEQREYWLPRLAAGDMPVSIAISEAGAGAHPKLLTTRAEKTADGWRITGAKAWTTNAPVAGLFIVLAVVAEEAGRKRFGAFLVPRDAPGLDVQAGENAGRHGAHCPVVLNDVALPDAALLPLPGDAYSALALPFRTLEDSIGLSVQAAAFQQLLQMAAACAPQEADGEIGALVGFAALLARGAEAAARALDDGPGRESHDIATLVGVKNLTELALARVQSLPGDGAAEPAAQALVKWFELMASVARRARGAYQERLAIALREDQGRAGS